MSEKPSLVAQLIIDRTKALVAIQEQHKPMKIMVGFTTAGAKLTEWVCKHCTELADPGTYFPHPCPTRKLADEGLAGEEHG